MIKNDKTPLPQKEISNTQIKAIFKLRDTFFTYYVKYISTQKIKNNKKK